jgi:glucose/arabinose dehydrogenase
MKQLTVALVLVLAFQAFELSGQGNSQQTAGNQRAANQSSNSTVVKGPRARRDPIGQEFRRAPMAESSRTIAIPLSTNLHIAFDVHLLRTHTAWAGEGLNVYGPPFHGGKSPFLCTYDGSPLWTMPPFCPWSSRILPANDQIERSPGSRFKGLSTEPGGVTLLYELAIGDGRTTEIKERPGRLALDNTNAVLRRFEVGPSTEDLWFCAHAEMGRFGPADAQRSSMLTIQRSNDVLLVAMRGWTNARWQTVERDVSYDVRLNVERKGAESDSDIVHSAGHQARAYLHIPAHPDPIVVEVASFVCGNAQEAAGWQEKLAKHFISVSAEVALDKNSTLPPASPEIFSGDKSIPRRTSGDEYYRIEHFPVPKEIALLATGMDWLPNGDLAVCTWSGEIYIVEHAQGPVETARYRRFARGLNEALGLKIVRGQMYVMQKSELTRVVDSDGNGEADLFETISDDWGYTGNYHAFAFGPVLDRENQFYAFLCGQRGRWDVPYVGWCVRINPERHQLEGFCSGLRAPNGFGTYGPDDDLFIADNQGNWVGACKLNHLQRGKFYGFPSGFPAPEADYKEPKSFAPPAVWFPRKLSPSTSGFVAANDSRFGPFQGQILIGDFQNAVVNRVFLEKVNGQWQGAVWPFAKGFLSGVNRLSMGSDGKLYVGGLKNSAWPAAGPKDYSLDRVTFSGKLPFEIKEARATPGGFELIFTEPADRDTAGNADNYDVAQYTYLYHQAYGSPEIDHDGKKDSSTSIKVTKAVLSADGLKVQLALEGCKAGYVTLIRGLDLKSADGKALWHDTLYYTLNQIP